MSKVGKLKEVFEDCKHITDYTKDGKCAGCGNCCSALLPVSMREIKVIKSYLKRNKLKPIRRILPMSEPVLDLTCPFRDEVNKKCIVYPVRPAICRTFICSKPEHDAKRDKMLYHERKGVADFRGIDWG